MAQGPFDLEYELTVLAGSQPLDPVDDNVDVEVEFENGARYGAIFFTLRNTQTLLSRWRESGECGSGLYFWRDRPIVVERLDRETID